MNDLVPLGFALIAGVVMLLIGACRAWLRDDWSPGRQQAACEALKRAEGDVSVHMKHSQVREALFKHASSAVIKASRRNGNRSLPKDTCLGVPSETGP
jgi:hypothetical protein